MSERKRIYLCLAHMSDEGLEQKYTKIKMPLHTSMAYQRQYSRLVCVCLQVHM